MEEAPALSAAGTSVREAAEACSKKSATGSWTVGQGISRASIQDVCYKAVGGRRLRQPRRSNNHTTWLYHGLDNNHRVACGHYQWAEARRGTCSQFFTSDDLAIM